MLNFLIDFEPHLQVHLVAAKLGQNKRSRLHPALNYKYTEQTRSDSSQLNFWSQDLLEALHSLGISPTEQEVVDMQCEVEKKGRIFFPDFCKLCLRKFREFDEENFRQELFKVRCVE